MNTYEINEALASLAQMMRTQEEEYIENGGEVTDDTQAREAAIEQLKHVLTTEGVDELGRRLAAKQAEVDTYKAEVKAAQARQKAAQRSVDYYKYLVGEVLRRTEKEAVKGTFYGFKQSTSTTNAVNLEALKEKFLDVINQVAHNEGLPSWADVEITAGVKNLQAYIQANDGEDADYLLTNTADTVTFSKPRKAKED